MKNKYKYILASLAVTGGCYILYSSIIHHVFATMLITSSSLILNPSSLTEDVKVEKMNFDKVLKFIAIAFFIFWVLILLIEIPEDLIEHLFHQWYYIGSLWLSIMIFIFLRYRESKI